MSLAAWIYLYFLMSDFLFVHLSGSVFPSLYIYLCLSVCPSLFLSVNWSLCLLYCICILSVFLSVCERWCKVMCLIKTRRNVRKPELNFQWSFRFQTNPTFSHHLSSNTAVLDTRSDSDPTPTRIRTGYDSIRLRYNSDPTLIRLNMTQYDSNRTRTWIDTTQTRLQHVSIWLDMTPTWLDMTRQDSIWLWHDSIRLDAKFHWKRSPFQIWERRTESVFSSCSWLFSSNSTSPSVLFLSHHSSLTITTVFIY